jgi:hypothetical protein
MLWYLKYLTASHAHLSNHPFSTHVCHPHGHHFVDWTVLKPTLPLLWNDLRKEHCSLSH